MPALAQYGLWWRVTESCSGLSGASDQIRWYVIPGVQKFTTDDGQASGAYYPSTREIVLAEGAMDDGSLVRHEMLHALLQRPVHDPAYFRDRCGGIVSCDCPAIQGPSPASPAVSARDLQISTDVQPIVVTDSASGGWIVVVVSATNPRTESVWVDLTRLPGDTLALGWEFFLSNADMSESTVLPLRLGFAPGERKQFAFDVRLRNFPTVPPGSYQVTGRLNLARGTSATITFPNN